MSLIVAIFSIVYSRAQNNCKVIGGPHFFFRGKTFNYFQQSSKSN